MRIGIDARELCGHATGVGRYLGGLLGEWSTSTQARRHDFILYAPGPIPIRLDTRRFALRTVGGRGGTWWEQIELPRTAARDHLDVWFSPAYSLPLRLAAPAVVAIHDLSFVAHPEWFRLREGIRRRVLCGRAAAKAAAIITISEFSRRELVERLGVPDAKIHVVPPGVKPIGPATSAAREHPIVLYVGSIFNRRNIGDLVRAFAPIARANREAKLALVGDNRTHPRLDIGRLIAAEALEQQVRWFEYVDDAELARLYREARAFAFLSEYEGLGLTPLEALAAGIPPVLLDTPVARESCGDAALYVPAHDLPSTTRALESALFAEPIRASILEAAPPVLARYRWPNAAADTLAVLESAAGAAAVPERAHA